MTLASCSPAVEGSAIPSAPPPADDLVRLSGRSVLFGHQSVGANVLSGIARLATAAGKGPRITELAPEAAPAPGVIGHLLLPENGDPARKIRAFADALDRMGPSAPDVALMKLCYVDFSPGTDVGAVFDLYRRTLDGLAQRHPRTVFVPVTVPLTTVQGGAKGALKRLFGQAPWGVQENARREEFNDRVRAAWGDRVFDLARLEATGPDGAPIAAEWKGRRVPALSPAYTHDGGHLNDAGQDRVARALVAHLASAGGR